MRKIPKVLSNAVNAVLTISAIVVTVTVVDLELEAAHIEDDIKPIFKVQEHPCKEDLLRQTFERSETSLAAFVVASLVVRDRLYCEKSHSSVALGHAALDAYEQRKVSRARPGEIFMSLVAWVRGAPTTREHLDRRAAEMRARLEGLR